MAGTQFIVAGSFIDGSGASIRKNVLLAVKDGIIASIGSAAFLPPNERNTIDDLSHCTILPALVDCSVSLLRSPSVDREVRSSYEEAGLVKKTVMLERHISDCHAHGVLGVAANDSTNDLLAHFPEQGPDQRNIINIRTSGRICQGSHFAADNSKGGDFLKINYSSNIEDEGTSFLQPNYKTLCHILRNSGTKKTIVVANGQRQVEEAIDAGCDAIEQGYGMGEVNLRKMVQKEVLWIPSVLRAKNALDGATSGGDVCCRFSQRYVAPGKPSPGAEVFWQKILAEQLAQLRIARESGITTALGTGAGSVGILHGESMAEEIKLFIKSGYSLEETIRCASENGAQFFGMDTLGILSVGRPATFLISRGTAQHLPRKLAYLEGLYVDGAPSTTYHKNPLKKA